MPFQSMENAPDDDGYCGDGTVQVSTGEECDDRNRVVTDGCVSESPVCQLPHFSRLRCSVLRSSMTPLRPWQSVNTHTAETDTATRALRSAMERTLDTRRVIHTFRGERSVHRKLLASFLFSFVVHADQKKLVSPPACRSYGHLKCTPHCVIDSTNCKYFT